MSLPKWVESLKAQNNQHPEYGLGKTIEALSIAWEALERIENRDKRLLDKTIKSGAFGIADYDHQVSYDAIRRIEELGGGKEPK